MCICIRQYTYTHRHLPQEETCRFKEDKFKETVRGVTYIEALTMCAGHPDGSRKGLQEAIDRGDVEECDGDDGTTYYQFRSWSASRTTGTQHVHALHTRRS